MDFVDELDVAVIEFGVCDVVGSVVVIGADIDHRYVSGRMCGEVLDSEGQNDQLVLQTCYGLAHGNLTQSGMSGPSP